MSEESHKELCHRLDDTTENMRESGNQLAQVLSVKLKTYVYWLLAYLRLAQIDSLTYTGSMWDSYIICILNCYSWPQHGSLAEAEHRLRSAISIH